MSSGERERIGGLKKNKHEASCSLLFRQVSFDWMMEKPASYGFKAYLIINKLNKGKVRNEFSNYVQLIRKRYDQRDRREKVVKVASLSIPPVG